MTDKPAPVEQVQFACASYSGGKQIVGIIIPDAGGPLFSPQDAQAFIEGMAQPLAARVAYLEKRLEVEPDWGEDCDGIACRNDTIKLQDVRIVRQSARIAELEAALVSEREENLWHAYHAGHAKDGRWTHMFMSDGEWLAGECGFDCRLADYDDTAIQAAIPAAAKRVLEQKP